MSVFENGYFLRRGDAVELLKRLPDESVDLIVTDPPYESLEKHRKVGTTTRLKHSKASSNDWFKIFPNERFPSLLENLYRILRKDRHAYIFCDDETSDILKRDAQAAGFKVWKRIVWDKRKIGMGYHYRARYEFILFLEKGKRKLANLGVPDVLEFERVWKGYPTEKPVELQKLLISQSSVEEEIVLDPFCGSGSSGEAALFLKNRYIGFDLSEEAIKITKERCKLAVRL